ncbi:hypothetical protein PFICI_06604 [Pestalotiopsis fici W106-1]|uniref:Uncharacterized protein n=1 Tax=Pestalotiopsis fici (strain W106-1 / CGMCC3.15140) TaxID=1229662 RepID=W3X863_PESFW|nr:uncharacterized protein PFICI_06604 [Pestalotiopsis fici W106-1]ETS81602.1 hypothetical protein PFICI_06604 [Pestalotiopsis fici W106-1]
MKTEQTPPSVLLRRLSETSVFLSLLVEVWDPTYTTRLSATFAFRPSCARKLGVKAAPLLRSLGGWDNRQPGMVDLAAPPTPSACGSADNKTEEENISHISAGWHRPVRADWQGEDGQSHSLPGLALSIYHDSGTRTAFFKLQARVDIKGCNHYLFYLHIAPEGVEQLALCSPLTTDNESTPTHLERALRFQISQPAVLVSPCWPCQPKNPESETNLHLLQLLGRATVFTLRFGIPCRTIPDASFVALSDALTSRTLKSNSDQANIQRYYRGQGGIAINLTDASTTAATGIHQENRAEPTSQAETIDQPPAYDQAVIEKSTSDPLVYSPPSKKRRRDSPIIERDELFAQSTKSLYEDLKQIVAENIRLAQTNEANMVLLRSKSEQFEKTVAELKDENRQLRNCIATMSDKLETLEQRLVSAGEELDRKVDLLEDRVTSLDAWTEDHECDAEIVKDLAREVIEEDSEELFNRLIARLTDRLQGS